MNFNNLLSYMSMFNLCLDVLILFTADLNNNINYVYCYLMIIHVQIEIIRICIFFNKTNYITLGPMFTICPRIRESLYFSSRQTTNFPHYRQIADHLQIMFTRRSNRGICQYFFLAMSTMIFDRHKPSRRPSTE
jgi:hypothetical protein